MGALEPYVKSQAIFVCPSYNVKPYNRCTAVGTPVNLAAPWSMSSYAPFFWRMGSTMATIQSPASKLFFTELYRPGDGGRYGCGVYFSHYPEANPALDGGNGCVLPVHSDGCNNGFYDGHVKWMKKDRILDPAMWDNP